MTSEFEPDPDDGGAGTARLFCDEMLMRLARWLRAAGHDTLLAASGAADGAILAQAVAERRCLITRDRGFLERREGRRWVLLLSTQDLDQQAMLLRQRLGLNWLYAPFSRCLVCNTPLRPSAASVPGAAEVLYCPRCDKHYWQGSHVRRMCARLRRWQEG